MYEKVEHCPICNGQEFKNFIICEDHTVSKESFAITKCTNCNLLLTNPRPGKKEIASYYKSEDYISHSNKANNIINLAYKVARNFTLNGKLKLVNRLAEKKHLLDYGCGTGYFLEYCKNHQWDVAGIEPDEPARKLTEQQIGENIYPELNIDDHPNKYDVITMWHVLEHVHDINLLLDQLKSILRKKGHLIIAIPNSDSFDAQLYQEHWAAYDVPRHLYHFNQLTFNELIKYHGFKLMETIPMKLDSFYVSMLSEKYKSGRTNYIKSMLNGWKSNRWAKKNNNNYSSIIYVLKKK